MLGVIATFTIPKILTSNQNAQYNAQAKEVASMISGAWQKAQLAGTLSSGTRFVDLTPYMSYVNVDTISSTTINDRPGWGNQNCSTWSCLKLHNGGILWGSPTGAFGGTASQNCIFVNYDPNGSVDTPNSGMTFLLYYNGFITTIKNAKAGSTDSGASHPAEPGGDPAWWNGWN